MMVMYNEKKWQRAVLGNNKAFWGMGLLWITSFVALLYDGKLTGTYSISVKPTSIVYAVLSFLLIYIVVYKIRIPHFGWTQHLKKWSEWVAKSSFLVYLVHPLCLNLLVKMSVWFGIPFIIYSYYYMYFNWYLFDSKDPIFILARWYKYDETQA